MRTSPTNLALRGFLILGIVLSTCLAATVRAEFSGYGTPSDGIRPPFAAPSEIRPPFVLPQSKQADFLHACGQKPVYGSNEFVPIRYPLGRNAIFKRRMHRMHREMMQPPRNPPGLLERWFGQ